MIQSLALVLGGCFYKYRKCIEGNLNGKRSSSKIEKKYKIHLSVGEKAGILAKVTVWCHLSEVNVYTGDTAMYDGRILSLHSR